MIKSFKFLKPYILQIIALFILVYLTVYTTLQLPDYMARIINQGIVGKDNHFVLTTGLTMLLISLLGAVATIGVGYFASRIGTGYAKDMREKLFSKVESFSLIEFNKFSTASLITRSTNDVQQVQMVTVMMLRMVLQAPITGVWAIVKAYHLAPSMSWIMALAVGVLVSVVILIFSIALPKFKILQSLVDKLNLVARQNLTGLRVIRAFNNEKVEESKFEAANQDLTNVNLFVNRLVSFMQPVMMLIMSLTSVLVVWIGAHLIGDGSLEIGNMIAFIQYSLQVISAFLMISMIFIMVPRASVAANRVMKVIDTEPVIKDPSKSKKPKQSNGLVEFKDVSFYYQKADTAVIENINFTANPGETTAIIGSTGSGKSTIINLIPRFYDVSTGEVLVDGINVKEYRLEELYRKIGYVPQKAGLFSGTVDSNIKYGNPKIDEKAVKTAAKIAQADEFIKTLPEKYKNGVAQGASNLSGGQKQRLSIARAIAKNPEILIFDDSFSALDFKTDATLREELSKVTKDKTVIIVAQRIATILSANKIIVLDDGKIVGEGNHFELIKDNKVYQEIAFSQLTEQELKDYETKIKKQKGGK